MRDQTSHGLPLPRLATIAGTAGLLGGAALAAAEGLSTVGPLILVPYALLVLSTALVLQRQGEHRALVRFTIILTAFTIATLIVYDYIRNFEPTALPMISAWGHTWRLGLMLGIGALVSGAAALLSIGEGSRPRLSVRSSAPTA
jgi:hypothetical protein